ncbi:MAG: hypothetical protein LBM02_07250 [Lachnospiraceae bacterium]|jgi:hypothetical protein|nr:hypothetical protein [Lachnospiraceae bacterium]
MVNLLIGPKGTGKTQNLIDLANQEAKSRDGDIVFIKKTHKETSSLSFKVRAVCMDDYPGIKNTDTYIGFLYGMYSNDTDIESIFIDNITKIADITLDNLDIFLDKLVKVGRDINVNFTVTISADEGAYSYDGEGAQTVKYEIRC